MMLLLTGFSKMIATEILSFNQPMYIKLNVYNLDKWDHHQQCNALPQIPVNYFPTTAELLNGVPVVCGANIPLQSGDLSKCFCHKLLKGAWVAMPTPPSSGCIIGAATSTLTLKSMS